MCVPMIPTPTISTAALTRMMICTFWADRIGAKCIRLLQQRRRGKCSEEPFKAKNLCGERYFLTDFDLERPHSFGRIQKRFAVP